LSHWRPSSSHSAHVNADSVGTEAVHRPFHVSGVSVCALLENVDHVQSDCTAFHAERRDVLSHMTAAPAALVVPQ
jgi:hypothetical protein